MRLCRFGEGRLGLVEGGSVRDVTAALDVLPPARYPFPRHDVLVANLDAVCARVRAAGAVGARRCRSTASRCSARSPTPARSSRRP